MRRLSGTRTRALASVEAICLVDFGEKNVVRPIILSVSKDPKVWRYRNTVLAGLGVAICPAPSVADALAMMERMQFAVVVLGQSIPEVEKSEFIRRSKAVGDVPIVCVDAGNGCSCGADSRVAESDVAGLIGAVASFTCKIRR